jgi:hypothetical protein
MRICVFDFVASAERLKISIFKDLMNGFVSQTFAMTTADWSCINMMMEV